MLKQFSFIYPVTQRNAGVQRLGGQFYEHVTDLVIKGVAYITQAAILNNISNKYKFDIREILFEGSNLYPNPEVFESLENIKAACLNHIEQLFVFPQVKVYEKEPTRMYPALAKVITMPLI